MEIIGEPRGTIDKEIAAFDAEPETALAESSLRELICTYPNNLDSRQVLVKVIVINALYHARVRDIDLQPLSIHISKIGALDAKLTQGDPEVVDAIWNSEGTTRHYPSFATKFCSWHNHEAYAIYDGNVWEALGAYGFKNDGFAFPERDFVKYAAFLAIVRRFQNSYGLTDYSLKDIDKFLWRVGGRLIAAKQVQPSAPSAV
ncbi:MAG TPA: hypothetical protein VG893_06325 [Terracidiphilus sp.]|nr:hypothetical protein [Terracidiphilus sp.]